MPWWAWLLLGLVAWLAASCVVAALLGPRIRER